MSATNEYVVRLRGLPWSATVDQVMEFLGDSRVKGGKDGVHMTFTSEGKPSGEAFVEFENEEDMEMALEHNNDYLGNRYIEVLKSDLIEMNDQLRRTAVVSDKNANDGIVRLRGLPFNSDNEEIIKFFAGLEIMPNGITVMTDYNGRKTGEAYVQFVDKESTEKALQKHREKIGHRYIEIFRSTLYELMNATNSGPGPERHGGNRFTRPSPYDRGDRFGGMNRYGVGPWDGDAIGRNGDQNNFMGMNERGGNYGRPISNMPGFVVRMRGLPYKATQFDICEFFKPIKPMKVHIIMERNGRASGQAEVMFETAEDAQQAMLKDRGLMESRYIELFMEPPNSYQTDMIPPLGGMCGPMGGGRGMNMGMGMPMGPGGMRGGW